MSIENLTRIESSIEFRMPKNGSLEERHEYLLEHGLYDDWDNLFTQYANLALDDNSEATKRSLFFLWYQHAEPSQLSGIGELDEGLTEMVLLKIDLLAELGTLDVEMTFMLPFYYQVAEWYFKRFSNLKNLMKASTSNLNLWQVEAPKVNWKNRGRMGDYWLSRSV